MLVNLCKAIKTVMLFVTAMGVVVYLVFILAQGVFASEHFLPISDPVYTPPSDLSVLWGAIMFLACLFFLSPSGLNDKKGNKETETK